MDLLRDYAVTTIVAKAWLYPTYDGIITSFSRITRADVVLVHYIYIYIYIYMDCNHVRFHVVVRGENGPFRDVGGTPRYP